MHETAHRDLRDSRRERFLVVRLGSLGDLVHTLPAVAALRARFPDAAIDWVVERKWSSLLGLVDGIDTVIAMDKSVAGHFACVRTLRQGAYLCAIDFQGLYKSAVLPWRARVKRRIGFDRKAAREPGAAWLYTERVAPAGKHVAEMNLSLATHAGAKFPAEMRFPLRLPESSVGQLREKLLNEGIDGDYIVVSPGGGWKSKCWPADRYGVLCAELWKRHGIRAVVNAGPGEDELAAEVTRAAAPAKPMVLRPSLVELCALLAGARVVVAADTGPLHLGAALGATVVALFGPTDPARNGPISKSGGRQVVLRNALPGATTYARGDVHSAAMLALTTAQVIAAVDLEMSVPA